MNVLKTVSIKRSVWKYICGKYFTSELENEIENTGEYINPKIYSTKNNKDKDKNLKIYRIKKIYETKAMEYTSQNVVIKIRLYFKRYIKSWKYLKQYNKGWRLYWLKCSVKYSKDKDS